MAKNPSTIYNYVMNCMHMLANMDEMHPMGNKCCDEDGLIFNCFMIWVISFKHANLRGETVELVMGEFQV